MLDFQASTIVFTVINLVVLYLILKKVLFGRVNTVLEARAALVKQEIDSAEASSRQAEAYKSEYEARLTDARHETAKLVADAQNRAQRAYEAKLADAEADAKKVRSEAEAQIAAEAGRHAPGYPERGGFPGSAGRFQGGPGLFGQRR